MPKAKVIPAQPVKPTGNGFSSGEHPLNAVLLLLIAFGLYANTWGNDYALDDWGAITGNPYVQEGFGGIAKIFTSDFWHITNIHLGYYRPLAPATFAIEHQFFHGNPHVSHLINALLFSFSGFILYKLLRKLFPAENYLFAFVTTLLFISHPIHTEVIANIKGRDELLSCLNLLLSTSFAIKYADDKKWSSIALSLLFCYFSLLSKETSFILVVFIPLIVYYYENGTISGSLKKAIPYAVAVVLFFIQKKFALGDLDVTIPVDIINYPYTNEAERLPTALMFLTFSLRLLILPHPLRYDYSYNQVPSANWHSPGAMLGILLVIAGAWLTFREIRKRSVWGLALGIFFITIVPGLAFTYLRGGIFAERFLFMPSMGFCILTGYALVKFSKTTSVKNLRLLIPLGIIFILYSGKTVSRNADWQDNYTLMSHDAETGAKSAQNQRHYGAQLINKANTEADPSKKALLAKQSILAFQRSLKIYPRFGDAWCEMGICYHTLIGNIDSAVLCYNKAIESAPALEKAYYYLGTIYENYRNQKNVASFYYNEAIRQNPEFRDAQIAADRLKKDGLDVHLNPLTATVDTSAVKDEQYYFKMGNYLASQGNYRKAAENFSRSIELKKDNEDAYINLANCYGMLKQYEQSLKVANEYLALHPDNVRMLKNVSVTYNLLGNKEESERYLRKAKELAGE